MDQDQQIAKDKRTKTYLLIIIGVLFIINFALLYNLISKDKILVTTETKLEDTSADKEELTRMVNDMESLIIEYKGKNSYLDSIIDIKNDEINQKVTQIRKMLSTGNITKSQLEQARMEINKLKLSIASATRTIDSLSTLNEELKVANTNLEEENSTVKKEVEVQKSTNNTLTDQNRKLGEKVKIASRLKATNIRAEGIMMKGSKEKEKSRLSRIDKVRIQFNIDKNEVADPGQKLVFLRLIGPNGSTIANQNAGSGTFEVEGESTLYTSKATVNFNNITGNLVVIYFDKIPGMSNGNYRALLYCDEWLIGEGSLKLK
jgi:FtsZ-binding cell division protein ZapB